MMFVESGNRRCGLRVSSDEFLRTHATTWIARRAAEFPVINVHAVEVAAPPERVFALLDAPELITPRLHWRALLGLRGVLGRLFRWDPGVCWHDRQPLAPGNHYAFFRIEHVEPAKELGLSVENKLTRTLVSFVIEARGDGSRVWNVTCAVFKGRTGRLYWRAIRPFHDAITEDWLAAFRRRAPIGNTCRH
jgi:uncharacterized protein YndB with AHSA1/START domain